MKAQANVPSNLAEKLVYAYNVLMAMQGNVPTSLAERAVDVYNILMESDNELRQPSLLLLQCIRQRLMCPSLLLLQCSRENG